MPTIKQKRAVKEIAENGGIVSKAMLAAGYSPMTAQDPKKLTESNGFKELMETYLSDEKLAKAHEELLNAAGIERLGFEKDISDEQIKETINSVPGCKLLYIRHYKDIDNTAYVQVIDNNARKNALDMAYKLKGRYGAENPDRPKSSNTYNFIFNAEDREKIKEFEDKLKERLINVQPS